jgi:hypothetical protein
MVLKYKDFFEKLVLSNYDDYIKLVADAYEEAESYDKSEIYRWKILSDHSQVMFKRLTSKVEVIFYTTETPDKSYIEINGKQYKLKHYEDEGVAGPYNTYEEMVNDAKQNKVLKISIDYSTHPVFTVEENIVLRAVHDYIVHILSGVNFTGKGEIAAFNAHAKLAPKEAIPAIFTEVVGQACYFLTNGEFPQQKIALLKGFDYYNVGVVDGYNVVNKKLVKS